MASVEQLRKRASERLLEERRIEPLNFGPVKPAKEDTNTPAMSEESEREPKTSAGCGRRMRNCETVLSKTVKLSSKTEKRAQIPSLKIETSRVNENGRKRLFG